MMNAGAWGFFTTLYQRHAYATPLFGGFFDGRHCPRHGADATLILTPRHIFHAAGSSRRRATHYTIRPFNALVA